MVKNFKVPRGQCNLRHLSVIRATANFTVLPLLLVLLAVFNGQGVGASIGTTTDSSSSKTVTPPPSVVFIATKSHATKSNFVEPKFDYNVLNVSGKVGTSLGLSTFQANCQEKHFQCRDKSCINIRLLCDGDPDCPDQSDELVELCSTFFVKIRRTSAQQLECFVEFARRHPELQRGKNDPTNPKRIQDLWNELSAELNALKGPVRTAKKWKETLSHWKNQLRSRARKTKATQKVTGGGPPEEQLSSFDQRALETFGAIVVDGLHGLPTLGTGDVVMLEVDENTQDGITANSEQSSASEEQGENSSSYNASSRLTSTPRASKKTAEEKMLTQALQMLEKREARDAQFQQQFLDQQKELTNALNMLLNKVMEK